MSSARRAAVLPLVAAIGGVLLAASPAMATVKATWTSPTDNSTFTTTNPIDFTVSLDRGLLTDSTAVNLSIAVPGPQPGPFTRDTASGSDRDLKFTFTPACPNQAGACAAGSAPAYNGRYTASLTGATTGSRTINLAIPPAAPTGVTATASGTHRVRVSWSANVEPDLTGYDVFTDEGTTVAANLPKDQTFFEFDLPSSGYGGTHGYVVRAHRLACSNCPSPAGDAQLDSPMSQPATVTFDEPGTSPSPTPDPGSGGGSTSGGGYGNGSGNGNNGNGNGNGSSGGSDPSASPSADTGYNSGNSGGSFSSGNTSKQTAQDQRTAFGLLFKSFSPKLGAPKLPPLPKFAGEAPLPEGTYDPMLDYGSSTVTEQTRVAAGDSITSQLVDSVTSAFEGRKLYRSIAIALLLLLAAGHLRLWLRHPDAN